MEKLLNCIILQPKDVDFKVLYLEKVVITKNHVILSVTGVPQLKMSVNIMLDTQFLLHVFLVFVVTLAW